MGRPDRSCRVGGSTGRSSSDSITGLFFSNELVDAFPVHRLAVIDGRPQELYVDVRDDRFTEVYRPLSDELASYLREGAISLPTAIGRKSTLAQSTG